MKKNLLLVLLVSLSLQVKAFTNVAGFYGTTWLDYVDEDGFGGGNFGNGTENNPWQIRSAGALAYLARDVNNGVTHEGEYFIIANNIDLGYAPSGTKLVWVPIGCSNDPANEESHVFKGTLTNGTDANGKPYEITGMTIRAYSTETTNCFGLFGVMRGKVDGLVVKNSNIFIDQTQDTYYAGTICGYLGKAFPVSVSTREGTLRHCTADLTYFEAKTSSKNTCVGGLVGLQAKDITEMKSNLAKSTMVLDGPVIAGGVVGKSGWETFDCHAVVDMNIKNSSTNNAYVGGVIGWTFCDTQRASLLKCCTASGEIKGDAGNIIMGGVVGYSDIYTYLSMNACTTCVALSGGKTMGGLLGYSYTKGDGSGGCVTKIENCYCSSYVDASKATYAGGLIGHVTYDFRVTNYFCITPADNLRFSVFAGTMKKPEESDKYGTIVGYAERFKSTLHPFGYFKRDYRQCALQTNSQGWEDDGNDLKLVTYLTPHPVNGDFQYDDKAFLPQTYMREQGEELFYKDNMTLAGIPFNVTNDGKSFFDEWDTTVDFQIGTFKNRSTAEEIATFTVPAPTSCVEVNENTVKVFDPGEVDVLVNYRGLQKKVHLDITYGLPWDGTYIGWSNYNDYFAGGDGTANNPYVIHNAKELNRVLRNENPAYYNEAYLYNSEGKHFILANDIFINTHLLGEDEQPKEGAQQWYLHPWHGVLHGNGKTIYGLYLDREYPDNMSDYGLFSTVTGTVTDLSVVDSYIRVRNSNDNVRAGIICGTLDGGTIERCMTHGNIKADSYAGGICGKASGNGDKIADCFSSVHVGWESNTQYFHGAGICYTSPSQINRCVSVGRVENCNTVYGISQTESSFSDCWFDRQMMAQDNSTNGATYTKDMIGGQILNSAAAWQNEENRYPVLKQFANTPYGDILSMAVRFDQRDCAGSITQVFEYPTENVRWWARSGDQYLDVINECGAATPNGISGSVDEHLLAQNITSKSECTKALRALTVNVMADKAGIIFEDHNAETAAIAAFDSNNDGLVGLREAFESTYEQFETFNREATDAEKFNELRFFGGFTNLKKDMISGLDKLKEITLPQTIATISTDAFNGCTSLEEVELTHSFTTLEEGGFYGSGIKNILVSPRNSSCRSISGVLYLNDPYDEDRVMLMAYPPGRGEENATLSVPLAAILPYAIYKVPALNNVYIDNCLPDGEMAELQEDGILHEDPNELMQIYVNDGSFNSQLFMDYYNDDTWGEQYYDEGRLAIYFPLNVTSALWATLYIDFPTQLPEGLKAYVADYPDEDEKIVELHSIGRIIPRSTPVAIKAESPGLYHLYKYWGDVPDVNKWENRFTGSYIGQDGLYGVPVNQETADEGSILTLGRNRNGVVGFYKYNGTTVPPYRAYLSRNNIIEGVSIRFGNDFEDETTSLDVIQGQTGDEKTEIWYTVDGRRLNARPTTRGIYIVNGKKIAIK